MKQGKSGETYNIGGHNEMENIEVVEMICDILDEFEKRADHPSRRHLITFVKDRPGHDRRYAIDFAKLRQTLDWRPEDSFESGLRKTIKWYLEHREWVDRVKGGAYQSWVQEHYG
jgi:dTDP-glucose 4,6-dehydratase